MVSRSLRAMAGSSTRKPLEELFFWQRHGTPVPANVLADERMARVMEAARRAPSWMNRQPWRFILTGQEILVYKMKHQEREGKDYHLLDSGIAMANLCTLQRGPSAWMGTGSSRGSKSPAKPMQSLSEDMF
jgi:nitroreductase